MKKPNIGISLLTALLLGATAQAEMITLGGDQTAGTGTLTVNHDLVFTLTANASQMFFIFDEIVTDDGTQDFSSFSGLKLSINGGSQIDLTGWVDNVATNVGAVTANDGYIFGGATSVSSGDIVTLHAGTGTMIPTTTTFTPWSSGDYNVFIVDSSANRISDVVPEPAAAGLLGISGLILFGIRRLKKSYGIC